MKDSIKILKDKYANYIIKYNNGEELIYYTKLKDNVRDLWNYWYKIQYLDWYFHIPWKYTMCPINLICTISKEGEELISFLDKYLDIARNDAIEDGNSMDNFYIRISYVIW